MTTKNGRRKKQIEFNSAKMKNHKWNKEETRRDACAEQVSKIKAKIARVGEWKYKTKKGGSGKTTAAATPKRDGKKPKGRAAKE